MNTPIRKVAIAALALFGLLILNVNYVQVFEGDDLRTDPGNTRVLLDEYERERGAIVVDGHGIARSVVTGDKLKYLRQYPSKDLYSDVTGFYSLIYGATGIEQTDNDVLSGNDNRLFTARLSDLLTGRDPKGGNVVLTLQSKAQQAAYNGLNGRPGAVVALDPKTGAILAMASSPSYDPNPIASHDTDQIRAAYKKYINTVNEPLLNRAISNTYPPGSTFKVIVSAAALAAGKTPNSLIDCPHRYKLPLGSLELKNFDDEPCPAAKVTLQDALTRSLNTAYANLGVQLGQSAIKAQAAAFGITDQAFTTPLRVAGSSVGTIPDANALAQSSIGQRDVRLTPLQGAMIAAAVVNNGTLMKPYLVKELQAPDFSPFDQTEPTPFNPNQPEAVSPAVAAQLKQMMINVVQNGTGKSAQIAGIEVGGKTGTAENLKHAQPHAWFIGFATSGQKQVAVAVMLEHAGTTGREVTGGQAAAPLAKSVIEAVLGTGGSG